MMLRENVPALIILSSVATHCHHFYMYGGREGGSQTHFHCTSISNPRLGMQTV